ncbi:uncharacterized protein LOC113290223 isoform X1 [Papaver somniferum]|uniref:uncharacterized protein LOC113290223 isoform X1 n=1 Tax=Papaver somniferum TaxID=3469 RepID=UPI000E701E87|nr:uncharacterized protein LOC113290223 isoform X1 [Papaver somniferum]XP_026395607.1 uncharacterized protein LOC113290223 isoform X1 [Papaver somniferum]XP_026395608.1 uncharacterized protein LOC113290223 isoform X1 [Papaver somniferum]XP_026395609.1 uncharacterized protein LOC113290223 isoform X1 [Papaver somniferum]XP_026395610.1 uncharacterized protein LOC113290223 isoform X1 [Papaver somniferum]
MEDTSFFDRMISNLRSTSKYYTGYPKDLGSSKIISFTSEREFVQLLHEGQPVAVAFTIKCPFTKYFDKVLEEAASEFHPHVKFMRVECPKYPGFCITRQRKDYPYIEIFHSPQQQVIFIPSYAKAGAFLVLPPYCCLSEWKFNVHIRQLTKERLLMQIQQNMLSKFSLSVTMLVHMGSGSSSSDMEFNLQNQNEELGCQKKCLYIHGSLLILDSILRFNYI